MVITTAKISTAIHAAIATLPVVDTKGMLLIYYINKGLSASSTKYMVEYKMVSVAKSSLIALLVLLVLLAIFRTWLPEQQDAITFFGYGVVCSTMMMIGSFWYHAYKTNPELFMSAMMFNMMF